MSDKKHETILDSAIKALKDAGCPGTAQALDRLKDKDQERKHTHCIVCGAPEGAHHCRGCSVERLQRIESKLDFMLRQNARKESVPLAPTAYSALAQAGMDPRSLSTHKVVTLLDDWKAEQEPGPGAPDEFETIITCARCKGNIWIRWDQYSGTPFRFCPACDSKKEDGDEQG